MSKATNDNAMNKLNRIKPGTNALFNLLFIILGLTCVIPILYVFMISISSEASITKYGYQFIPHEFSGSAYRFLWEERGTILKALLVSVEVTVLGTVLGVALTTLMGYVLSRPGYKLNGFLTIVVFIPMIFSGGMVANYVVVGQVLSLSNTLWALILPLCVSSFNVTISRTFFRTTIPDSIIESAKIDGATQMTVFAKIVLPISKPVLATVSLFSIVGSWNDFYSGLIYMSKAAYYPLMTYIQSLQINVEDLIKQGNLSAVVDSASLGNTNLNAAKIVVAVIPLLLIYPLLQRYFVSGIVVGSVKG